MDISQIFIWTLFLFGALYVLLKGADVVIESSKRIGLGFGLSPYVIGVLIVGFGTSLPELASSIAGVVQGAPEIVLANVVGSNITNILLIVGLMATIGGTIVIKRDLLQSELPIFLISTIHFVLAIYDGYIDKLEALLLLGTFGAYMWYITVGGGADDGEEEIEKGTLEAKQFVLFGLGLAALLFGANYTVEMAVNLATAFNVPLGIVSIVAIAVGTSLPELIVSLKAIKTGEAALAIGNIFGSNAFNALMVTGIPALIATEALPADDAVMKIGLAVFAAASGIFFVNALSRRIMRWEGVMMIIFFCFFLVKLFELL
jgi:cation:H+ antiporter